ncbi:hypothetical protein J1G36_03500 [Pseudomonas carnis]|nr:hypothetical protein [Pseudomonas carnis]
MELAPFVVDLRCGENRHDCRCNNRPGGKGELANPYSEHNESIRSDEFLMNWPNRVIGSLKPKHRAVSPNEVLPKLTVFYTIL